MLDIGEARNYKARCTQHQEGGKDSMEEMLERHVAGMNSGLD